MSNKPDPRMKDPPLHHWKKYPMPQSDMVPLGLVQGQLLRTYLNKKRLANSPYTNTYICTYCANRSSPQVAAFPHVIVMPKQVAEKCSWGPHYPICKNEEEHEEDWDSDRQRITKDVPTKHSVPPRYKTPSAPRHRTLSNPSHKTFNALSHKTLSPLSHLMSLTDTLNKFD